MKSGGNSSGVTSLITLVLLTISFILILLTLPTSEESNVCTGVLIFVYLLIGLPLLVNSLLWISMQILKAKKAKQLNDLRERYSVIRKKINIPATAKKITYYRASDNSPYKLANSTNNVFLWKTEEKLFFFPSEPNYANSISITDMKIKTIPVSRIEYFSTSGEVFRENKISGGGGGGSSLGGAVAGGLIAGGVGAIIGSRKQINSVNSEVVTHDTRETYLNFFDDKNDRYSFFFDPEAYIVFNDLIPEKEHHIVYALKSTELIDTLTNTNNKKNVTDQIRELGKLRDEGLLTEEEFQQKKRRLLNS